MSIRQSVVDFLANGPLPDEAGESVEVVQQAQRLLEAIEGPVTDEEAQALVGGFGPDSCFGLAWSLLHLIETAPGSHATDYPADSDNAWV